jgi:hypothetical protein
MEGMKSKRTKVTLMYKLYVNKEHTEWLGENMALIKE